MPCSIAAELGVFDAYVTASCPGTYSGDTAFEGTRRISVCGEEATAVGNEPVVGHAKFCGVVVGWDVGGALPPPPPPPHALNESAAASVSTLKRRNDAGRGWGTGVLLIAMPLFCCCCYRTRGI
jgi:hypothetical protein